MRQRPVFEGTFCATHAVSTNSLPYIRRKKLLRSCSLAATSAKLGLIILQSDLVLRLWLPGLPCPPLCSESSHLLRQRFPGLHFLLELGTECRNLFPLCVGCQLPSARCALERLSIGGKLL